MWAIDKPKFKIWYKKDKNTGKRTLDNLLKTIQEFCGLDSKGITKKFGCAIVVSRMTRTEVHPSISAKITGYKTLEARERYNQSAES
jgi:hypothetical protein